MSNDKKLAELYATFSGQVFAKAKSVDVFLLAETLQAIDSRSDDVFSVAKPRVWNKIKAEIAAPTTSRRINQRKAIILIAVVILSLCTVAYAIISWRQVAEITAYNESSFGFFDTWNTEQKALLLSGLIDSGLLENSESGKTALAQMDDKAITQIIATWVGLPNDAVSLISVLERILGPFSTWSIENKAWYTRLLIQCNLLGADEELHLLPETNDLSQDQALTIAKSVLINHGLATSDILDSCAVDYDFYQLPERAEKNWLVSFRLPLQDELNGFSPIETYSVCISNDGEVISDEDAGIPLPWDDEDLLSESTSKEINGYHSAEEIKAAKGEEYNWTLAERALFIPWYSLPTDEDISEEAAIDNAKSAILLANPLIDLDSYREYSFFVINDDIIHEDGIYDTYWRIDFYLSSTPGDARDYISVKIDSKSGEILGISGNEEGNG